MKMISRVAVLVDRKSGICLGSFTALVALVMFLLAPIEAYSGGPSGPAKPSDAFSFKEIPGSTIKQVILKPKSAERLGIETDNVSEKRIFLKQMVGGRIIPPVKEKPVHTAKVTGFGAAAQFAKSKTSEPVFEPAKLIANGEAWVVVTLTHGEWDRVAKGKPARIHPLATRDNFKNELLAMPSGMEPIQDMKRTMLNVYYKVPGKDHGLKLNDRVRVELQQSSRFEVGKVVPYSAVYYDAKGTAWVYLNPEPLVFQRQKIVIDRIVGDLAVLSHGPPVGASVVTVGAALLYGTEVVFKR